MPDSKAQAPSTADPQTRNRKAAVIGTAGGAHFIHDGFSDSLYVLFPLWAEAFGLSFAQVGALKMVFSGFLAGLQVPSGVLAERIGERWPLVLGTVLSGIGFMALGWAGGFVGLAICLAITGAGSAVQHPLASAVVSKAFPTGGRRAALGTYNFMGDLGKVVVPASVAAGVALIGWQGSAFSYGAVSVAGAIILFIVLGRLRLGLAPDAPVPQKTDGDVASRPMPPGWGIRDRFGFSTLAAVGMIDSASRLGFLTFLPFILIDKGATAETVGFALILVFIGGAIGKLVCGLLAERLGIIRTVVLTELATVGGIIALLFLPFTPALMLLPFVGIALNGTSSVIYGTIGDFVDPERQPRAFGLFYTLGIGSGAASPLVFGALGDVIGVPSAMMVLAGMVAVIIPLCLPLRRALNGVSAYT